MHIVNPSPNTKKIGFKCKVKTSVKNLKWHTINIYLTEKNAIKEKQSNKKT